MNKDFHNDVNPENLDMANKILSDSKQLNDIHFSKPDLEDILTNHKTLSKHKWKKGYTYAAASLAACFILAISFRFLPNVFQQKDNNAAYTKISSATTSEDAVFASDYSEIYEKLCANTEAYYSNEYSSKESAGSGALDEKRSSAKLSSDDQNFYDTNEQTEKVHEGDIVKTDGKYIYTLRYSYKDACYQLLITKADGLKMKIVKKIKFNPEKTQTSLNNRDNTNSKKQADDSSDPSINMDELYVHNDKLIVIGTQYMYSHAYDDDISSDSTVCYEEPCDSSVTYIYVYDISKPEKATFINKLSQDGSYVSSRMKDNFLYTITTHQISKPIAKDNCVPAVNGKLMTPEDIYLPEQTKNNDFTVITGMDVTSSKNFVTSKSVLGGSSNIYASQDNIYVINTIYDEENISDTTDGKKALKHAAGEDVQIYNNQKTTLKGKYKRYVKQYIKDYNLNVDLKDITAYKDTGAYKTTTRTEIIKFQYADGNITFMAENKIDGHTEDNLNFDEKDGYLRCVTTENSCTNVNTLLKCYDKDGEFLFDITEYTEFIKNTKDTNNVFVLDDRLNLTAEINGLAKGESIYSARYLGDYGYFVTYEQTDPLFSVDFSDMENPKIIGKLKMPGYSEYLHFYDEDTLLGFGLEESGIESSLKLEMFHLKNGTAEKEAKALLKNYSYSESMYDYKSIMVDTEKNLIGFTAEKEWVTDHNYDWRRYYVVYTYKNKAFQELYKIKINKNSCDVRGFYIDNYLYVVSPEYGIYAIDMETYHDDNKVEYVKFDK